MTLHDLVRSTRQSARALLRRPAVSLTVVLTLALGIGANTAIYTVVHALVLEPLPYPDPHRLVYVWGRTREAQRTELSGPEFDAIRTKTDVLSPLAEVKGSPSFAARFDGAAERVVMASVSSEYFDVYGIPAALGRTFVEDDSVLLPPSVITDASSQWPVLKAVISHDFWQRRFGGDPEVLGEIVTLNGRDREIIGVMPAGFRGMLPSAFGESGAVDGWYLSPYDPRGFPRDTRFIRAVGRLAPGVSFAEARAVLDRLAAAERDADAIAARDDWHLDLIPLHEGVTEAARESAPLLVGSVVLVLLIACANVTMVLLARTTERTDELALRRALGGDSARLAGLVVGESVLLALAGGALGILLAWAGTRALVALRPPGILHLDRIGMDGSVLAFTLVVGVAAALLAAIAPAFWIRNVSTAVVAGSSRKSTAGSRFRAWGKVMVTSEVALALVLALGAGLLIRSFTTLASTDPGFRSDGIMTAKVSLPLASYPSGERAAFYARMGTLLEADPNVASFGAIAPAPLDGAASMPVEVFGAEGPRRVRVDYRRVTPGALETLEIPILRGRAFTWADYDDPDRLFAVVDERFAEETWPGRSPVGQRVVVGRRTYGDDAVVDVSIEAEVIGVAAAVRGRSLRFADPPTIYVTLHFNPGGDFTVLAAGHGAAPPRADLLRSVVTRLDPGVPAYDYASLRDILLRELRPLRYALLLVALLGGVGMALAATGVFGLLAYAVGLRRRELSIRAALGAAPAKLLALVLGDGAAVAAVGLAAGWLGSQAFARVLSSLLYEVGASDPVTFAGVAATLALVLAAACWVPGVRAARSDPAEVLREEG